MKISIPLLNLTIQPHAGPLRGLRDKIKHVVTGGPATQPDGRHRNFIEKYRLLEFKRTRQANQQARLQTGAQENAGISQDKSLPELPADPDFAHATDSPFAPRRPTFTEASTSQSTSASQTTHARRKDKGKEVDRTGKSKELTTVQQLEPRKPGQTLEKQLAKAIIKGQVDKAKKLLLQPGINLNAKIKFDTSLDQTSPAQTSAAQTSHPRTSAARTLVGWAARHGHADIARLLIEKRADPSEPDDHGETPLHLCAYHGHANVAKLLLEYPQVDVNATTPEGATALHYAASHKTKDAKESQNYVAVVKHLLDGRADPNILLHSKDGTSSSTALSVAAECGHLDIVRRLVQHPGIDAGTLPDHTSTVRRARHAGQPGIAQYLAAAEANQLPAKVRADLKQALALDDQVKAYLPGRDRAVWKEIAAAYPVASQCLSCMLARMTATADYQRAPPEHRQKYLQRVTDSLKLMQENWKKTEKATPNTPGFVDFMMALSKKSLGREDAVLFNKLSEMYKRGQRFNLQLREPFDQTHLLETYNNRNGTSFPLRGFCFQAGTEWLGCEVDGAQFAYRNLDIPKTIGHQKMYVEAYMKKQIEIMDDLQQRPQGAVNSGKSKSAIKKEVELELDNQFVNKWLGAFSKAQAQGFVTMEPSAFLAHYAKPNIVGCMVGVGWNHPDGRPKEAHAVPVKLGKNPMIFDPNVASYANRPRTDFGTNVQGYLEQYKPEGGEIEFDIAPVVRTASASTGG